MAKNKKIIRINLGERRILQTEQGHKQESASVDNRCLEGVAPSPNLKVSD